jgi:hypothetical protein
MIKSTRRFFVEDLAARPIPTAIIALVISSLVNSEIFVTNYYI